ncbi:hypothetical protein DVB69_16980 [Sporosarcina sp. BI001-red]|uniref:hypothetical protein n=1 Tax=Sporosarcina sp. BI001-red TaxID=2282866 RepID=UPI000E234186|nr:hypothetical protein [Sporosarcina sp. BI001-red]REB04777.1 hypothetical protein DVB69_16980 [Sporosarcina sp. BI001-red]
MKITPNPAAFKNHQTQMQKPDKEKEDTVKKSDSNANKQVDQYIPSQQEKSVAYEKPTTKADIPTIERLKAESEKAHENLMNLVRQLLQKQGISMEDAVSGKKEVVVDEQVRLEAQAAIGEGGDLSAEKVSDRIVEFANAISGGDKSKFDLLKNAIEEGFNEAKKALGGKLPEISQKTYDLVMDKLNQWKEEV